MGAIFRWIRELWLGRKQLGQTTERATAALPQTNVQVLFNVAGGRIAVLALVAEVTTNIGAVANDTRFSHTPTGFAEVDLCAPGTDINGHLVGRLYGIDGIPGDPMLSGIGVIPGMTFPVILAVGALNIRCLGSDGGGGRIRYTLKWAPIDDTASVAAA